MMFFSMNNIKLFVKNSSSILTSKNTHIYTKRDYASSTTLQSTNFIKYQQLTIKISNQLNFKKKKKKKH